jgi:hypothetical protein
MNAKYYPALRKTAALTQSLLNVAPTITEGKINKPSDMIVSVNNVLLDELKVDDKDIALEVCKMLFYGYHIEINNYYKFN